MKAPAHPARTALTGVGPRIKDKEVDDTEQAIGLKLPPRYRGFLSKTNGGLIDGSPLVLFCIDATPKNPVPFGPIAGSDLPPETLPIAWVRADKIEGLDDDEQPRGALIIAHRGPREGEIFFWNDARWTPFVLARHRNNKRSLEDMFAKAYAAFFETLEPVAASFGALRKRLGGKLVDCRPPITEADLATFEARHELLLPREYRSFLLRTNGGRLEGSKPLQVEQGVVAHIPGFFARSRTTPLPPDLRAEHRRVGARIPKGTVPIASGYGQNLFLLDVRSAAVLEWIDTEKRARAVAPTFDAFIESALSGELVVTADAKPTHKLTERDYREFVSAQLAELTPALVDDLQHRVFALKLPKEVKSLDFEVFAEGLDRKLPIVGYQMDGPNQVSTDNVAILPDRTPIIPARLFAPFRGTEIDDEERLTAELVMQWFIDGWRKAGGPKRFSLPASIVVHDSDAPVRL